MYAEYTSDLGDGLSLTDTVYGKTWYSFTVQDQYGNQVWLTLIVAIDNQLRAYVAGTRDTENICFLEPGESATMSVEVEAQETEGLSSRWYCETLYADGRTDYDSVEASGTTLTSAIMTEDIVWMRYECQTEDLFGNVASVQFTLRPTPVVSGICGSGVTWSFNINDYTLMLAGSGRLLDYSYEFDSMTGEIVSDVPWHHLREYIRNVIVEEGITDTGDNALAGLDELRTLTLPATLQHIPVSMLRQSPVSEIQYGGTIAQWSALEIPFPNGNLFNAKVICSDGTVDMANWAGSQAEWELDDGTLIISGSGSIWDYAVEDGGVPAWYYYKDQITSVVIQEGITYIGGDTFTDMPNLTHVTIPEGVVTIGQSAFQNAVSLQTVDLPSTLETIEMYAFMGCRALTEMTFHEGLESIDMMAFAECTNLTTIYLPTSITEIGAGAFAGAGLTTVYYAGTQEQWSTLDFSDGFDELSGLEIICDDGVFDTIRRCGNEITWSYDDGRLVLDGTGEIWNYAYENGRTAPWSEYANDISEVVVSEGITTIGEDAFAHMTNLATVRLPESLHRIGNSVFQHDSSLRNIELPAELRSIGERAFYGCGVLETVTIPENIGILSAETFMGCSNLRSVSLPNGIWCMASGCFAGCGSLSTVYYDGCPSERARIEMSPYEGNPVTAAEWIYAYSDEEIPADRMEADQAFQTQVQIRFAGMAGGDDEYTDGRVYDVDSSDITSASGFTLEAQVFSVEENTLVQWAVSDKQSVYADYTTDGELLHVNPKDSGKTGKVTVTATALDGSGQSGRIILNFVSKSTEIAIQEPASRRIVSGQKLQLKADLLGSPTDTKVDWSVLPIDEAYITVSSSGLVTAKNAAYKKTITVYADAADGGCGTSIDLEYVPLVSEMEIYLEGENVTGGKLNYNQSGANTGLTFLVKSTPSDAEPNIEWSLNGKAGVASLAANADGSATIRSEGNGLTGTVTLTATAQDGSRKSASLTLNIGCFADHIAILSAPETLAFGKSVTLTTNIADDKTLNDKAVIWRLREEDAPFASISSNGKLTASQLSEPVDIQVTAEAKATGALSDPMTVHLVPPAEMIEIYYKGFLQDTGPIGLDLSDDSFVLTAQVLPELASQNGAWSSSNEQIAVVDQMGKVTPLKAGNVKITFTVQDGSKTACSVNLYVDTLVSGIEIYCAEENAEISSMSTDSSKSSTNDENTTCSVRAGKTLQLKANVFPLNVIPTGLVWSIEDGASYATINKSTGLLTAKKGILETQKVIVKVTTPYFSTASGEYVVLVKPENDNVIRLLNKDNENITGTTVALSKGKELKLLVLNATDESLAAKKLTWKSSKPKIAEVSSNGTVTAKSNGKAEITASYVINGKTYSAKITVNVCVPIAGVKVTSQNNASDVFAGKTLSLTAAPTNQNASSKKFTWKIKDPVPNVSISSKGVLSVDKKLREPTTVSVVAIAADGSGKESTPFNISVWPKADSISVYVPTTARYNSSEKTYYYTLGEGQSLNLQLYYSVLPNKSGKQTMQKVTWSSSDSKIAKVDKNSGNITIMKSGKVTITATSVDGYKKKGALTFKFGTIPTAVSVDEKTMTTRSNKSNTMKATLTNPNPSFTLMDSTVKWTIPTEAIALLEGKKDSDKIVSLLDGQIKVAENGKVDTSIFSYEISERVRKTVKEVAAAAGSSTSMVSRLTGVSVTSEGNLVIPITVVSNADSNIRTTAALTIVPLTEKEKKKAEEYEAYQKEVKSIKNNKLKINPQAAKIRYYKKNDKNVYYRETGICSLNSAITLLNRYVAYKYKDYRNYYDIQKMLEFNGEKYVEWNYEFTDAKAKAAHAGRKATVKKGSELGILTDYGVNNSFSNSTKIPYEFKDEKGKIIKSKIQFKRTECTGKGLTPKKLAELLIEHPEGVYIHGANSNGPHAVVVASYTFDGSTYKFRVLDPAKGAADFTVKNKDSKIMKTWGITLSQLDEYRVIIKG